MKRISSALLLIFLLLLVSCKAKTVTVSFDVDGGTYVSNIVIDRGTSLDVVPETSKDGYTFLGWYYDKEFTKEFDISKKILNDLKLYAKFEMKFIQFSPHGLEEVNNSIDYRINYTITFEYLDVYGERGSIYFKIEGAGSTATADSGILESNLDPEGITWLANDKQYMCIDGSYMYIDQDYKSGNKMGIYYYSNYFRSSLLSTSLWQSSSSSGYYKDDIGYYYINSKGNYLRIDDDTIILTKESGQAFSKTWIAYDNVSSKINYIDRILVTNVNKTNIELNPSDLANAIPAA